MNMIARGQAALNARMQASAGVTATYTRASTTISITPWVGRTVFKRGVQEAAAILFGERDYMVIVAELVIDGVAATPKKGDRITETIGGVSIVFEAMAPNDEPVWRHSDQTRTVFRVHCKRV